jgi:hypothetical protein
MMKKTIVALFAVMMGCGSYNDPAHRVYHGLSTMPATEQHLIEQAMERLSYQTSGAIQYDVVWDSNYTADNTIDVIDDELSPRLGYNEHDKKISHIVLARKNLKQFVFDYGQEHHFTYETLFAHTVLHELVHSVGVEHLSVGLMNYAVELPLFTCVDKTTMSEIEKYVVVSDPKPCNNRE